MNLGDRVAVISDVHGERRMLRDVLSHCRASRVTSIVLLGDLFDRLDQAEACAECLRGWNIAGVLGNHEREVLDGRSDEPRRGEISRLLANLTDRLRIENALFVHDGFAWKAGSIQANGSAGGDVHLTFAGHTHYRQARDENGPLDLSIGRIRLNPDRRYLINPGAVVEGQFAVWDRDAAEIIFERI